MNVRITFSYMVFFQKSFGNVVTVVMMMILEFVLRVGFFAV